MKKIVNVLSFDFLASVLVKDIHLDQIRSEFMPRGGKGSLAENYRQPQKEDAVRHSAVALILNQCHFSTPHVLITQRALHLKHHKGQLSFPGGRVEPGESHLEAAIRETQEEVGISLSTDCLVGELTPLYVFGSRNWVQCFVFLLDNQKEVAQFTIDPSEVADAFYIPLNHFLGVDNRAEVEMDFAGYQRIVPHWKVPQTDVPLWGATALLLNEFITRIELDLRAQN